MEHCILRNRGQGCHCQDKPQSLGDRKGEHFPVESAWGCRNELFNAKPLWLADKTDWRTAGAAYARLAFLREGPGECARCFGPTGRGRGSRRGPLPGGFTIEGWSRSISPVGGGVPFGRRWNGREPWPARPGPHFLGRNGERTPGRRFLPRTPFSGGVVWGEAVLLTGYPACGPHIGRPVTARPPAGRAGGVVGTLWEKAESNRSVSHFLLPSINHFSRPPKPVGGP